MPVYVRCWVFERGATARKWRRQGANYTASPELYPFRLVCVDPNSSSRQGDKKRVAANEHPGTSRTAFKASAILPSSSRAAVLHLIATAIETKLQSYKGCDDKGVGVWTHPILSSKSGPLLGLVAAS